ncbi:MAG TPA: hypothetical protein DD426_06240 [Clostridiaceae bacterium]|nr:hypothetical protein [Clostridiaceae bacterium]
MRTIFKYNTKDKLKYLLEYLQDEKTINEHLIATVKKDKTMSEFNRGYAAALILINKDYKTDIGSIKKAISI